MRRSQWVRFTLLWTGAGVLMIALGRYATPAFLKAPVGGRMVPRIPPPPPDLPTLLYQLGVGSVVWYVAIVALPMLLVFARYLDAERLGLVRTLAIALGAAATLIAVTSAIDYFWTYRGTSLRPPPSAFVPVSLRQHLPAWLALIGLVAAIEGGRRAVQAAVERERLRAEVARQRLIALTGQLRPHFLFNTLQAISTLIYRDPAAADEILTRLGDLLSDALRHRDCPFVPLQDEVRYARTWLEIARARYGARLEFEMDVPQELNDLQVPLFIVQPLLENALSHGIGGVMKGGRVIVRARRTGRRLCLDVIDDGAGLPTAFPFREGIGLANTRERLATAYGSDYMFALTSGSPDGTRAHIDIPATLAPPTPRA
ncbi:MAG TPA: histidine kinase [Vicinamibacterales bacterium]|nr:histidine kinase [Vicinamibacterales bacterium]